MRKQLLSYLILFTISSFVYCQSDKDSGSLQVAGSALKLMENQITYSVKDFRGEEHQNPDMGCELSDYGSWYDAAYCSGINRFIINTLRHHTYDQSGFNTTQDIGQISLILQTNVGKIIDGSKGKCEVNWYPYGWETTTKQDNLEIESHLFFSSFNTITLTVKVKNTDSASIIIVPGLLVTGRSEYDGKTGGLITGSTDDSKRVRWSNKRIGKSCDPKDYTDVLIIGSSAGDVHASFLPQYFQTGQNDSIYKILYGSGSPMLRSNVGTGIITSLPLILNYKQTTEFAFYIASGPDFNTTQKTAVAAGQDLAANGPGNIFARVKNDWDNYFSSLPKLYKPSEKELKLYYSSALSLRVNHVMLKRLPGVSGEGSTSSAGVPFDDYSESGGGQAQLYDASCPARGGFNLFFQSDACWNILGYLDINTAWAAGHALPVLDPTCIIMDPHYYWSMWELYSRIPDTAQQHQFARLVYPLLKETYKVWTTRIDIDHNLLCSTPNNWDDGPRADLLFREARDIPGQWNSWWDDWVRMSRDNYLEDPASSSLLAYGTVVMQRLANILGYTNDAEEWAKQYNKSITAIDSLWDEKAGYWTVRYKHHLRDNVLTSSILYPVFTDMCRDTAKIRRVIEDHILNPSEFNGPYPIPTVAYNSPRYYKQKPPRTNEAGGLWRGNIWMPEAWIIVKGLYKYGYEDQANDIAHRLTGMMSRQEQWTRDFPQFGSMPAEYYDSRTGAGQHIRKFSWTSAVAMEFLLGNFQNERVLGTNARLDSKINGHLREIYEFQSGRSLFRVKTIKTVFPYLQMASMDSLPIEKSTRVKFGFSDPAGNFGGCSIFFSADPALWSVFNVTRNIILKPDVEGYYKVDIGEQLMLINLKK